MASEKDLDKLQESEIDYEYDYYLSTLERAGVPITKEQQEKYCWDLKKGAEEKKHYKEMKVVSGDETPS